LQNDPAWRGIAKIPKSAC